MLESLADELAEADDCAVAGFAPETVVDFPQVVDIADEHADFEFGIVRDACVQLFLYFVERVDVAYSRKRVLVLCVFEDFVEFFRLFE